MDKTYQYVEYVGHITKKYNFTSNHIIQIIVTQYLCPSDRLIDRLKDLLTVNLGQYEVKGNVHIISGCGKVSTTVDSN